MERSDREWDGGRSRTGPDISVVIPVYNEEDNIEPLCTAILQALDGYDRSFEVILVDDGSDDATPEMLASMENRDRRIRPIVLSRNSGQTLAMGMGFKNSRGRIIVSMDGDLQNDPRDIPRLVERLDAGFDVVCGWRKNRKDRWLNRTLPSKIANRLIAAMTGIPIHDNGCSLKAYRAEVIRSLNLYSEMHRFLPALSAMTGARVDEVVVRHHPRIHGESKYGIMRTFRVLSDMLAIKMLTQFSSRPGVWFGLLSLPFLFLGCLAGALWFVDLGTFSETGKIVFSSSAVLFLYLFGSMISLSFLSEMFLYQADRTYLRRLMEVLTISEDRNGAGEPGRSA